MTEPKAEVYVTVLGEKLRLIMPGMGWNYEEAKLAKLVSEGMTPIEIEQKLLEMDPDAWMSVLRVSFLRAGKDLPTAELARLDLLALMESVLEAVKEATKDLPPTSPSANGSTALDDDTENEKTEDPSSALTT